MEHIIYKLVAPRTIKQFKSELTVEINPDQVLIKPLKLSICHADYRYYSGNRPIEILKEKLPMALIHEGVGEVVQSFSEDFPIGTKVVMLPNILRKEDQDPSILENYNKKAVFLSSKGDGFLQNYIVLPLNNVLSVESIQDFSVASFLEPMSVCVHACKRVLSTHTKANKIAIWGDGNLSFLLSIVIKELFPDSYVTVVGKHSSKLEFFTTVDKKVLISSYDDLEAFDVGFEVVGGAGAQRAINDIIQLINPMGKIILMGVSEEYPSLNTRDILEKGLTILGASRSGKEDFIDAIRILSKKENQELCRSILYKEFTVRSVEDIDQAFQTFEEKKGRVVMDLL